MMSVQPAPKKSSPKSSTWGSFYYTNMSNAISTVYRQRKRYLRLFQAGCRYDEQDRR